MHPHLVMNLINWVTAHSRNNELNVMDLRKIIFAYSSKFFGRKLTIVIADAFFRLKNQLTIGPSLEVKAAFRVDASRLFIHGCSMSAPLSLVLVLPDGKKIELDSKLEWYRDDLLSRKMKRSSEEFKPMFVGLIDVGGSIDSNSNLRIEVKGRLNWFRFKSFKVKCDRDNPLKIIKQVLSTVSTDSDLKRGLFDTVYGPVIESLWATKNPISISSTVVDYGLRFQADNPIVSMIIPLYGRYDFMEYQLSAFSLDADLARHEIIYVVDDPEIESQIKETANELSRLYDMHFRVVYLSHNLGFSGANNLGVQFARADSVLLLNSDILPSQDGWLSEMYSCFSAHNQECILGARLLFEDGTIQHDGMEFFNSPQMGDLWTNTHPGKGLPESLFHCANKPLKREAVTGACMLMKKTTFTQLDGFDEKYILGDFEDSDLCMKATTRNIDILLDTNTRLYHLERQSQSLVTDQRWKEELTYYNCWQHHEKWDETIVCEKMPALG